ncbi:MAG: biotin/lipoyl-binding protein [Synechococcales cyanobacterium CRU_2_2]|nr:biotin/lipoyl-binding protein [Synechococcales cyanobacterium CRU_2_2]
MGSPRLAKSSGLLIAGLSVVALGIVGFGIWMMLRSGQAKVDPNAVPVVEPVRREVTALGRVEPDGGVYSMAAPSSRNSGNSRVLRVLVKKGDRVKQGQPLAVMDSYDGLRADVLQAEAVVRETQAQLAQVRAGEKIAIFRPRFQMWKRCDRQPRCKRQR